MESFEIEAQHLREMVQSGSRMLEEAGYEAVSLADAIGCALADARRVEQCERELGAARERMKGLEGCLTEAVSSLRREGAGRAEVLAKASTLIPIQETTR